MNVRRCFIITLLAAMMLPASALADPGKNESGHGRKGAKQFWKQQEKRQEMRRKEREKAFERQKKHAEKRRESIQRQREKSREALQQQQERRWEDIEKHQERNQESWEHRDRYDSDHFHFAPPRGNYVEPRHRDHGYGYQGTYPRRPDLYHAYPNQYGYPPPSRFAEDLDAVYTPFGFYQDVPQPYGYGPSMQGYGQIGPFRFEVWEDD